MLYLYIYITVWWNNWSYTIACLAGERYICKSCKIMIISFFVCLMYVLVWRKSFTSWYWTDPRILLFFTAYWDEKCFSSSAYCMVTVIVCRVAKIWCVEGRMNVFFVQKWWSHGDRFGQVWMKQINGGSGSLEWFYVQWTGRVFYSFKRPHEPDDWLGSSSSGKLIQSCSTKLTKLKIQKKSEHFSQPLHCWWEYLYF